MSTPSVTIPAGTDERRPVIRLRVIGLFVATVAAIFGLFVLLVVLGGASPGAALRGLVSNSVGNKQVLGETLIRFAPLAIIAVTLVPSLRAGLFNIGAPGQIGMGALAAGMVSLHVDVPRLPLIVLSGLAAAAAGGAWAAFPGVLRARLNVNEILATLVFNFLAAGILGYLLAGPLQGNGANIPQSDLLPNRAALPILISGTRAHVGILLALVVIAALAVFGATPAGYRLRLFSASPSLAVRAGLVEGRLVFGTICLGGMGAGIAGWLQVAGVDHLVYANVADAIGYTGLFVALLGGLAPLGILVAAFFFGALLQGGNALQLSVGISPEIVGALIGMILLGIATFTAQRRRGAGR